MHFQTYNREEVSKNRQFLEDFLEGNNIASPLIQMRTSHCMNNCDSACLRITASIPLFE